MRKSTILFVLAGLLGIVIIAEIVYIFFVRKNSLPADTATPAKILPSKSPPPLTPTSVIETLPSDLQDDIVEDANTRFALIIEGNDTLTSGTATVEFEGMVKGITSENNRYFIHLISSKTDKDTVFYFTENQISRASIFREINDSTERTTIDKISDGSTIRLIMELDLLSEGEASFKSITITELDS